MFFYVLCILVVFFLCFFLHCIGFIFHPYPSIQLKTAIFSINYTHKNELVTICRSALGELEDLVSSKKSRIRAFDWY